MTNIVLQTKLFVPRPRPNLVARPSLIHKLNIGLGPGPGFSRKLTLVSAPAGYGKTTLVVDWLQRSVKGKSTRDGPPSNPAPAKIAWLSLDENDNDATRFLTYFIAALQTVDESMGQNVSAWHPSAPLPQPTAVVALLLNQIAAGSGRFVCVLDDYHLISNSAIHDSLRLLVAQMPPRMHLVLISRADPPLPLARLRVAGQMTEIRTRDLRFSAAETTSFLNDQRHLSLTDEAIHTLEQRTEGWIAGLHLAAMALQETSDAGRLLQAFAGDHRYLADYLMSEVMERQPADVQQFLLKTAVLERLTGPLCDAVCFDNIETPSSSFRTAGHDSQQVLEQLERRGLFLIPLDDTRRWYRYHALFSQFLTARLRRTQPQKVITIHRRASDWYHQHDMPHEAIRHARATGNTALVLDRVAAYDSAMLRRGEANTLVGWLVDVPLAAIGQRPGLCLNYAWALFATTGHSQEIRALLHHLHAPLPDSYQGELLALRTSMAFREGNFKEMMARAGHALEHLSDSDDFTRSLIRSDLAKAHFFSQGKTQKAIELLQETLPLFLAKRHYLLWARDMDLLIAIRVRQGLLREAADLCHQALVWATDHGLQPLATPFYSQLGKVLYEWNDLDTAAETLRQGLEIGHGGHRISAFVSGSITLARIQQRQEGAAGAQETLQRAREMARAHPWQLQRLQSWQSWPLTAHGWVALAVKWAAADEPASAGSPTYPTLFYHLKLARDRINEALTGPEQPGSADLEQTVASLEKLSELAQAAHQQGTLIEALALLALAYQARAEEEAALSSLDQALALAEPAGYVRTFVDEGASMARLLHTLATRHRAGHKPKPACSPHYLRTLLTALAPVVPPDTAVTPLTEPLSPRQQEIVQLLGQGLSNPEIAARLHIAVSTVRWHVKNIYRKLDVHNRTQAALKARALGLLVE